MAETMPTHPTGADVGAPGRQPARLRLSSRERNGLTWLQDWSRKELTHLKRRRKYRSHEQVFEPDEAEILRALVDLEKAASRLLATGTTGTSKKRPAGYA